MVNLTREQLAEKAGTTERTIARIELEEGGPPRRSTADAIRQALEAAGVIFIDQNGDGPGVRLAKVRD
jgi:transcriptional regulator with XRE-family HTH domain